MKDSKQEEIIAALWTVCSLLAFGFGYVVWGWVFALSAGVSVISSIAQARLERKQALRGDIK